MAEHLLYFAELADNNGGDYDYCILLRQFAQFIQLDSINWYQTHIWKSIDDINAFINVVIENNTPKSCKYFKLKMKEFSSLIKAMCVIKKSIDMGRKNTMFIIIYYQQYLYTESQKYHKQLLSYSEYYNIVHDFPWNVKLWPSFNEYHKCTDTNIGFHPYRGQSNICKEKRYNPLII